jgi:hypothetical protein
MDGWSKRDEARHGLPGTDLAGSKAPVIASHGPMPEALFAMPTCGMEKRDLQAPPHGRACHPGPSGERWPAGALLPEGAAISKATSWAWRTLRAATEELQLVVDGVIDDLEGLGQSACTGGLIATRRMPAPGRPAVASVEHRASSEGASERSKRAKVDGGEDDADDPGMSVPPPLPLEDLLFGACDEIANDATPVLLPQNRGYETSVGERRPSPKTMRRVPSHDFEIINFEDELHWDDEDGDDF